MSIAFSCENCGKEFQTDASNAGKRGKCKQCGHPFVIPKPQAQARPKPPARPAEPRAAAKPTRPNYLDETDDPYGLDDVAVKMPDDDGDFLPRGAPSAATKRKKRSGSAMKLEDWERVFDEAPKYLFLLLIGGSVFLALFAGVSQIGRAFLPTGIWCLYWTISFAFLIGMILVGFRESLGWGIAWVGASVFNAVLVNSRIGPRGGGLVYLPAVIFVVYYFVTRWRRTFPWFGLLICNGVVLAITMAGVPELRQKYAAYSQQQKQQRAELQQPGAEAQNPPSQTFPKITVEVTGLSDAESIEDFSQQLITLSSGGMSSYEMRGTRYYTISSDTDPQEIARRITWAKVAGVDGSTIRVAASPLRGGQQRPPESDFVGRVLYDLKAPRSNSCREALDRLQRTPPDPDRRAEVASAIEPILKSTDGFTQIAALHALAAWGGKENTPAILPLLRNDNIFVVSEALKALGALKDPSTVDSVAAYLAIDQHRGVAAQALQAMGSMAEPAVLKLLDQGNEATRTEALKVLESIGTEKCIPAVQEALRKSGGHGFVAMNARQILERLGASSPGEDGTPTPRRIRRPR